MASDRTRYYDADSLTPIEEIPLKTPTKVKDEHGNFTGEMRSTTRNAASITKFAKATGGLPGVTSILNTAHNYNIEKYRNKQITAAAALNPFTGDVNDQTQYEAWHYAIMAQSEEHAKSAANEGTAIHAALDNAVIRGVIPDHPIHDEISSTVVRFLNAIEAEDLDAERSFGSRALGFAGTPDLSGTMNADKYLHYLGIEANGRPTGRVQFKLDYKSRDKVDEKTKPYPTEPIQLGAYRGGTGQDDGTYLLSVYCSRTTGYVHLHDYDRPDEHWHAFQHLFEYWVHINGYDPRKWVAA